MHVAFDGGTSKASMGTAGYVIVDARGQELVRKGLALGAGKTNNEAESAAAKITLQHLAELQEKGV